MDDPCFFDAELDRTTLGRSDSSRHVHGHSPHFRVWHHAARTENLTKTTDQRHHVRRCDTTIEVDGAAIDDLKQIFSAHHIRTSCLGFIGLGTAGEHTHADRTA